MVNRGHSNTKRESLPVLWELKHCEAAALLNALVWRVTAEKNCKKCEVKLIKENNMEKWSGKQSLRG
jgi:hypothetical protein